MARHLPVFRGEVPTGIPAKYLADPECWAFDCNKGVKNSKLVSKRAKEKASSHSQHAENDKVVWDFETRKWIPNEIGTQAPPSLVPAEKIKECEKRKKSKKRKRSKKKKRPRSPSPSPSRSVDEKSAEASADNDGSADESGEPEGVWDSCSTFWKNSRVI